MIFTISGNPGSGKTTVAEFLSKKFKLKLYTVGEMARQIAAKRGISVEELSKLALKDSRIDREIDSIHKKIHGNFILDSRIGFHFFPKAIKMFLYCEPLVAAKRIYKAKRPTERLSLKETIKEIEKRQQTDRKRYKKYYGIDIQDIKNYDIIIGTSNMNKTQVDKMALRAVKQFTKQNL